jgi:hypothetical protein
MYCWLFEIKTLFGLSTIVGPGVGLSGVQSTAVFRLRFEPGIGRVSGSIPAKMGGMPTAMKEGTGGPGSACACDSRIIISARIAAAVR